MPNGRELAIVWPSSGPVESNELIFKMRLISFLLSGGLLIPAIRAKAIDDYQPGPDSQPKEGAPKGKVTEHRWTSRIFPGTVLRIVPSLMTVPLDMWVDSPTTSMSGPIEIVLPKAVKPEEAFSCRVPNPSNRELVCM